MKCENGTVPRSLKGRRINAGGENLPACDADATHEVGSKKTKLCAQHAKGLSYFHRRYGTVEIRRLTIEERAA